MGRDTGAVNEAVDRVFALIPAYEEAPRVAAVVQATRQHLPVLVVDDGSTDDTASEAEAAGATVIRQVPNAGKGAALRAGFRQALADGAAAVVTLDADGQHDPAEIPAFLWVFRERRPGLIVGRRDLSAMPPVRRLSNVLGGAAVSLALGRSVPDNQSDVAVCRAVAAIARSLGLGLVAEGVESEAQRQFLLQLGVPVGQGFLFAPGLAPDEFVHRLDRNPNRVHA